MKNETQNDSLFNMFKKYVEVCLTHFPSSFFWYHWSHFNYFKADVYDHTEIQLVFICGNFLYETETPIFW